jgi:hypothetical protein
VVRLTRIILFHIYLVEQEYTDQPFAILVSAKAPCKARADPVLSPRLCLFCARTWVEQAPLIVKENPNGLRNRWAFLSMFGSAPRTLTLKSAGPKRGLFFDRHQQREREEPFCWCWLVLAIQPLRAQRIYNFRVALVQSAGIFIRNRARAWYNRGFGR